MKPILYLLSFSLFLPGLQSVGAQTIMPRDPVIAGAVDGVEVTNLRRTVSDLVAMHNRNNLSSATDPEKGIGAAADYLWGRISEFIPASDGRLSVEKITYRAGGEGQRLAREVELCNIVATIEGVDPSDDRIVAVLAHYDDRGADGDDASSFAPGANDNGSGVACLVEMARLLSGIELDMTVKLIFLSGEEHGLYGADHMAEVARRQGWCLVAVLNNDMIGNSNASETDTHDNTVLRVFSEGIPSAETPEQRALRIYNAAENDGPSRQAARYIKEIGERYVDNMTVRLIYRSDRFGRGGDHSPFNRAGFAAVRLCEANENYYRTHRREDEIDGMDFEYLRKNTGVNLAAVANLAMAPAEPQQVTLDASRLENTTRITWQAPPEGKTPTAYYVLVRRTDSSQWQKKILVTALEARLPYSKDNYFFAVQSVSTDGHESLPAFAVAPR